ncbi:MAG: hypothetical protein Q7N50_10285, partial [Armatimonadota bacterium]|nr:hypothetical protein [Armatimonadota bacterium]
ATHAAGVVTAGTGHCRRVSGSTRKKRLAHRLRPHERNGDNYLENRRLVAVLDVNVRLNKLTNCMIANSLATLQAEGDKKSKQPSNNTILKEMVAEQEGLCKLYEMAANETKTTFNEIRDRKKLLNQQFVFSILQSEKDDNDGALAEEEIGLFSSIESCSKVEEVARDHSIPTRKCREWKDISELFKGA